MRERLKTYIVSANILDAVPAEIKEKTGEEKSAAFRAWHDVYRKQIFKSIADAIRETIVPEHFLEFTADENGYAVSGGHGGNPGFLLVKTTQAAVEEIKKINGVSNVYENARVAGIGPVPKP